MERIPAETLDAILDHVLEDEGPTTPADCITPLDSDPLLDNLRAIRLVCKTFKDAVEERFWGFYENYSVLLERDSLKKLKRIAQNKHTRCRIKVLWIFTYQFKQCLTQWSTFKQAFKEERASQRKNYLNFTNGTDKELPFSGSKVLKAFQAYKQVYARQQQMNISGERKAILADILELLDGHVSSRFHSNNHDLDCHGYCQESITD